MTKNKLFKKLEHSYYNLPYMDAQDLLDLYEDCLCDVNEIVYRDKFREESEFMSTLVRLIFAEKLNRLIRGRNKC